MQDHGPTFPAESTTRFVPVPGGRLDVRPVGDDSDPVPVGAKALNHRLGHALVDRHQTVGTLQGERLQTRGQAAAVLTEQANLCHGTAVEVLHNDAQWNIPALRQRASTEHGQQGGTDGDDDIGSSHTRRESSGRETELAEHPGQPRWVSWHVMTQAAHRDVFIPFVLSPGAVTVGDLPGWVVRVSGDHLNVVVPRQPAGHAGGIGRDTSVLGGVVES